MLYLDTHVVVWLYAGATERFKDETIKLIEDETLLICPIVRMELQYLNETGRVTADASLILETLGRSVGLTTCDQPFAAVVLEAVQQNWTRDPFDRLIVAQASIRDAPLLSKDQTILDHYRKARW